MLAFSRGRLFGEPAFRVCQAVFLFLFPSLRKRDLGFGRFGSSSSSASLATWDWRRKSFFPGGGHKSDLAFLAVFIPPPLEKLQSVEEGDPAHPTSWRAITLNDYPFLAVGGGKKARSPTHEFAKDMAELIALRGAHAAGSAKEVAGGREFDEEKTESVVYR